MRNKVYKGLVILFYLLSFSFLLYCIKIRITPNVVIKTNIRLSIYLIVCILIYISGYILVKKLNFNKKILIFNLVIYFIIYTITICTLTLFDEIFGRQGFILIRWDKELLQYYFNTYFNIIPFKTILLYINGYLKGYISYAYFCMNIFGNILAFMPYAIFIPLIFKSVNKYYKIFIIMILSIIMIEILQFFTLSGSCDIDDVMLNMLGVSVIYFITKIKCVNKFIHKVFLLE